MVLERASREQAEAEAGLMVRALVLRVNASAVSRLAAPATVVQTDRTSVRRTSRHPRLRQAELRHAREPDRLSEERGLRGNEYGDIRIPAFVFVLFWD